MNFNDLLIENGFNPECVLVLRHRPREPQLNKVLPWLAAERQDLFNAYQQTQGEKLERVMKTNEYWNIQANIDLKKYGLKESENEKRSSILCFDLSRTDFYASWKGKHIVDWPGGELSWWRRAHKNEIPIHAIFEDGAHDADMPKWDAIDLTWEEFGVIPSRWKTSLS
jgi:hypothetical protein